MSKVACYVCENKGHYAGSKDYPLSKENAQDDSNCDDIKDNDDCDQHLNLDLQEEDFEPFVLLQFMNKETEKKKC